MSKRYGVLRFYIGLLKVMSIVVMVAGIVLSIAGVSQGQSFLSYVGINFQRSVGWAVLALLVSIAATIFVSIGMWAGAEYLEAHIDTEENTRAAAAALDRLVRHQTGEPTPDYERSIHGVWGDD
jgi:Na+/H+-dicarboxylate symporter